MLKVRLKLVEGVYLLPFFLNIKKYIKANIKISPPLNVIHCWRDIIPNKTQANGHHIIPAIFSIIDLIEEIVALIEEGI